MPTTTTSSLRAITAVALCLLAVLAVAACGGSSNTTKSSATGAQPGATATGSAGTTVTTPSPADRKKAAATYRKCLESHGAGLPRVVTPPGASVALGHLEPPKGVSQKTYDAAVRACGGTSGASTAVTNAVKEFATCMREGGVKVPEPGKGKGLFSYLGDVKNPKFAPTLKKCAPLLKGVEPSAVK